jgi:hypothetical protein
VWYGCRSIMGLMTRGRGAPPARIIRHRSAMDLRPDALAEILIVLQWVISGGAPTTTLAPHSVPLKLEMKISRCGVQSGC